jgi:nucleoside-diphosphate-sugar epimerase
MRSPDDAPGGVGGQINEPRHVPAPGRLLLTDTGTRPNWCPGDDERIQWVPGDLCDPSVVRRLVDQGVTGVFHLAGIVSGAAEADFDRGLRVNLDATRALAMACAELYRRQMSDRRPEVSSTGAAIEEPVPVRFVHASSIAVYGVPLPAHIDDGTQPWPTLSYGAQKLACELLLSDMSRRGMIDSLSVRLSGVVVRPALPNGALSAFNSDLIRETLAGRRIVSPVSAAATLWLQSITMSVRNLVHAMVSARCYCPRWRPACRTSSRLYRPRSGVMCRGWLSSGPTRPSSPCSVDGLAAGLTRVRCLWGLLRMRPWRTLLLLPLTEGHRRKRPTRTADWAAR